MLQAAYFMLFMFQLTFCITFFQNCCSCSSGVHIFAKRLQAILIKVFDCLTPIFAIVFVFFALLSVPIAVPIAIFSLHARIKILLLAAVPCIFRPQSPVSKVNVCIDATILSISYTICCFLCAFHASSTVFYKKSSYFLKICSPPSVGSMILKAAQKQNHEKYAS